MTTEYTDIHFVLPTLQLQGDVVALEPLDRRHAPALLETVRDSEVWRFLPVNAPRSLSDMEELIEVAAEARDAGVEVPFVIRERRSGAIVGSTRYMDISALNRSLEIGWTWIAPEYQRTAVNTEAKLLLLSFAFESAAAVRVQLKTDRRNIRSQRAIERLGAVREGVLRSHRILPDGYIRDSVFYSILASEWPTVRSGLRAKLGCNPQTSGG